jgi:hypothetical protein
MKGTMGTMIPELQQAKETIEREVGTLAAMREEAWQEEPWPLFPGAKRLRVVHPTLRRWRCMRGSGLLEAVDVHHRWQELLFYLSPEWRYLDDRAWRRWVRRCGRDLRRVNDCREALESYLDAHWGGRSAGSANTDQPAHWQPWQAINEPLEETVWVMVFGPVLGGKDAVLDCPLPQLWQLAEYHAARMRMPGETVVEPGDKWRRKWLRMQEQIELGEDLGGPTG